jgi:mutator protein MutT
MTSSDLTHPESKMVEVSAGLIFRDQRLLIAQRPPGTHLEGFWEFPGGKREPNESWEACLARELLEELGIKTVVGSVYSEIRHEYPGKVVLLRFYITSLELDSPPPSPMQCAAVRWISQTDLASIQFPPADAQLIQKLSTDDSLWH